MKQSLKVMRGGSCFIDARVCRSGLRWMCGPGSRFNDVGFRIIIRRKS